MNARWVTPALVVALSVAAGCGASSDSSAETTELAPASVRPAQDSGPHDEAYGRLLLRHVDSRGMVDYAAIKAEPADLEAYVASLAGVSSDSYESWDRNAKIAFWINAYNALTLKVIVDHYPIRSSMFRSLVYPKNSIRQIPGVWDELHFDVMGRRLTLNQIEHEILRAEFDEARIHMALVCAAVSCPPLRWEPFSGEKLDLQLEDQTVQFMMHEKKLHLDRDSGTVYLSSIFDWFGEDFIRFYGTEDVLTNRDPAERAVLNFLAQHLEGPQREFVLGGEYDVEYLDYDWTLNDQSTTR